MQANLLLYWDYELQKGSDQRFLRNNKWDGYLEHEQTEKILDLLKNLKIKSTFAMLGYAAEKGDLPYHSQKQVKKISRFGHEIASHSYLHEYLSDITYNKLLHTLQKSKKILERVTKKKIISFVPPYNMPLEYFGMPLALKPGKSSISKLNLSTLFKALSKVGYRTCRINKFTPIRNKVFKKFTSYQPKIKKGIMQFSLNCNAGFTSEARQVVQHAIKNKSVAVVYGHPHSTNMRNKQNLVHLEKFLHYIKNLEDNSLITVTTPSEIYYKTQKLKRGF